MFTGGKQSWKFDQRRCAVIRDSTQERSAHIFAAPVTHQLWLVVALLGLATAGPGLSLADLHRHCCHR